MRSRATTRCSPSVRRRAGRAGERPCAAWLVPVATVLVFLAHHAIVPWAQRTREGNPSPPGDTSRRLVWGAGYLVAAVLFFMGAVLAMGPAARTPFLAIAAAAA